MKKLLSLILCISLLLTAFPAVISSSFDSVTETHLTANDDKQSSADTPVVSADTKKADASKEDDDDVTVEKEKEYPILFVPGIGQTFSYMLNEDGEKSIVHNNTEYKFDFSANLFNIKFKNGGLERILKNLEFSDCMDLGSLVFELLLSYISAKYLVDYDKLSSIAELLLYENIIDENGKLPESVLTPIHNYPISEYPEMYNASGGEDKTYGKFRFYNEVPCRDILEDFGEENVFCYNYAPFGNISDIAKGLDKYINEVVFKYFPDAEKVVLIPMSMGAAVTSQYLYDYAHKGQVARVVSIVGCWDGSDVIADLIEGKLIENSAEMCYTQLPYIFGDEFTGNLLQLLLRFLHKENVSSLIRDVLSVACDTIVLKTPSLLALIPSDRYEAIRENYLSKKCSEDLLRQTDAYYNAQITLKERMEKLSREQGVEFYFLSGYGMELGDANYPYFKFMNSSNKVNSDEIINIESTCPGTVSVPSGQSFSDEYLSGKNKAYISPDKSIDITNAYYRDRSWFFYGQKHELEDNNTALKLAFDIASGKIKSVNDYPGKYPQFNESRDFTDLSRNLNRLEAFIETNKDNPERNDDVKEARAALEKGRALLNSTINDRDEDDKVIDEISALVSRLYPSAPPKTLKDKAEAFKDELSDKAKDNFVKVFAPINEKLHERLGCKGFPDLLF